MLLSRDWKSRFASCHRVVVRLRAWQAEMRPVRSLCLSAGSSRPDRRPDGVLEPTLVQCEAFQTGVFAIASVTNRDELRGPAVPIGGGARATDEALE